MAIGEASPLVDVHTIQVHQDAGITKPSLLNSFFSSPKTIPEGTLSGLLRSTLHFLTPEWHSNDAESVSTPGQSANTIDNSREDKGRKPGTPRTLRRIRRQSHLRTPPAEERLLLLRRTPSPMEFLSPLVLQMLDFPTPDDSYSTASSIQIVGTQPSLYGSVHDRLPIDALVEVFRYIYSNTSTVKSLLNVRGVSRSWRAAADTLIWQSLIASPRLFDAPLSPMTIQNLEEDITLCSWFQDGLNRQQTLDYVTFSLDEGRRFDRDLAKVFTEALLKCKRACVEIDLNSPPGWSTNHHLGASDPSIIPLHQFLWKSNYLGIGNCIPSKFYFPWPNLRDGIPWSQLTTLYLDCPLSIDDARHVLSEGRMTLERASLSYIAPNDSGTMGDNDERPRHPPIYAAELKLIVHHLFSLTIHTCVDLTPLFSSFVFQSLKHLDLRVRGQLPHDTPPLLDHNLDIPWAGLMSLSLFSNNNMDPCLIHPILIKCRKLRRFEWYGDLTDFPVSGSIPFSDLPPFLEEVKLHSDGPGLDILIQTFSNLPVMAKMPVVEISAFHRLLHHQEPYRSVTHLSLTSTLGELFLILRSWRETLVSGDFTIEGCTTDQLQMGGISCRTLKRFGISSPTRLESLWKVFFAPVLENLHISLEGLDFSLSEIPPFLRSGKPSVFRIGRQEQLEFGAVVRTLDWDKSLT